VEKLRSDHLPGAVVRCVGRRAWRASVRLRPDQTVVAQNLQLHKRPLASSSPWWGRRTGKSTLFSLCLRFNTVPARSGAARRPGLAGLARRRILRLPPPLVPQQSSVFSERWQRRSASTVQGQQRAGCASSTGWQCRWTSSKPCRVGYAARIEERRQQFFRRSNCNGWRLPGRCSATRPCCWLDEATSALDAESKAGGLQQGRSKRWLVATVRLVDCPSPSPPCREPNQILAARGRCIVEQGSHDQLMARDGRYRLNSAIGQLDPGRGLEGRRARNVTHSLAYVPWTILLPSRGAHLRGQALRRSNTLSRRCEGTGAWACRCG